MALRGKPGNAIYFVLPHVTKVVKTQTAVTLDYRSRASCRKRMTSDPSPAVRFPLILLNSNQIFCATHSLLFHAAELHFDPVLASADTERDFFATRDNWVEQRVADVFRTFLPQDARLWQNVCEESGGQYEHDVLVQVGNTWIVVEAKGGAVRQNFFDPDRAFIQIRDDFRAVKGIQKAYDQGERLRQRLLGGKTQLFDRHGSQILATDSPAQEALVICVTGHSWGIVAIDLSFLLEKADATPYPWAVCIDDLEAFLEGLTARGKHFQDFLDFLCQRSRLHGRAFSDDELNIGGYFLEQGALPNPPDDAMERFLFTGENSTVFDELYYEKHGTSVKYDREAELRKYVKGIDATARHVAESFGLATAQTPSSTPASRLQKVGRNDPCPCGSGAKYKRCCGR